MGNRDIILFGLSDLRWLSIRQRHDLHTAVMIYKIKNNLAPSNLSQLLTYVSSVNAYETRGAVNGDLAVPNVRLVAKKRTFEYRASEIWNSIPGSVRTQMNVKSFKDAYMTHILSYT